MVDISSSDVASAVSGGAASAAVIGEGGDVGVRRDGGSSSGRADAASEGSSEESIVTVDRNNAANYHARVFVQNKDTVRQQ